MGFNSENFDQEFSLNKNTSANNKKNPRGKIPSWLMILAGAAVIGGVVIANQPSIRPVGNSIRPTLSVTEQASVYITQENPFNDQQADEAELAAHFASYGNMANAQFIVPVSSEGNAVGYDMEVDPLDLDENGMIIPPAETETDASVVWIDGNPYAISIQPRADLAGEKSAESAASVYQLNGRAYEVQLDPVSPEQITALSDDVRDNVIQINGQSYLLSMTALNENEPVLAKNTPEPTKQTAEILAAEHPTESAPQFVEQAAAEQPVMARLNDRTYSVSVKPYEEPSVETGSDPEKAEGAKQENKPESAENVPAADAEDETANKPQTTIFSVNDNQYALELMEIDSQDVPAASETQPVIWLDETPLEVQLVSNGSSEEENTEETAIDVELKPLPQDQTLALQRQRFGEEYVSAAEPTAEPQPTEEPTPVPTQVPEENNFIVNLFNNFFGSAPTEEPTPEVTVIPLTPTPTVPQPTATAIVVRLAPTATPQRPVRLDETKVVETKTVVPKGNDLDDPALREDEDGTETNRPTLTPTAQQSQPTKTAEVVDTVMTATAEPTVQPTPEELPQTGMAEGWNIPSMLAMLAGLLLVILGVRRLRTGRE